MRQNIFLAALKATPARSLKPGLESNDTVELDDIHEQIPMMPTKTGPGEEKGGDAHPDATKEIGEDHEFGSEDRDWVADSQMHTVALEAISATMDRYSNMIVALEEIADTVETQLEVGRPLDPVAAAAITTAIDASEVGAEPLENQVALEAFSMDLNAATEGFVDRLRSRAGGIAEQWMRGFQATVRTFVSGLKEIFVSYKGTVESLKKAASEFRASGAKGGKDMGERKYSDSVYAASGDRSIFQAFMGSLNAFTEVRDVMIGEAIDARLSKITLDKEKGIKEQQVRAAVSELQSNIEKVSSILEKHKAYSVSTYDVSIPNKSIDFDGDIRAGEYRFRTAKQSASGISGALKTATPDEVDKILDEARSIEREFHRITITLSNSGAEDIFSATGKAIFSAILSPAIALMEASHHSGQSRYVANVSGYLDPTQMRNASLVSRSLAKLLRDLATAGVYNHATAAERNTRVALKWIKDSISVERSSSTEE